MLWSCRTYHELKWRIQICFLLNQATCSVVEAPYSYVNKARTQPGPTSFDFRYNRVWHQEELSELEYDTLEFEVAFNQLRDRLPKRVFWRESTAQHFDTLSGKGGRGETVTRLPSNPWKSCKLAQDFRLGAFSPTQNLLVQNFMQRRHINNISSISSLQPHQTTSLAVACFS